MHVLQVFGHHPTADDHASLAAWLTEQGLGPHDQECRAFDAALLLDPLAVGTTPMSDWAVIEGPAVYLQQLTTDEGAAHALATTWLPHGGRIIFGGHLTFTPIIVGTARQLGVPAERVTLFQSRYFVTDAALDEHRPFVEVVALEPVGDDRDASLTAMRRAMVDAGADALVAIGGRTAERGLHRPGIDEEIDLARERGVRIFLVGEPGGRAAELAADEAAGGEEEPTGLSAEERDLVARSDEYEQIADLIWRSTTTT